MGDSSSKGSVGKDQLSSSSSSLSVFFRACSGAACCAARRRQSEIGILRAIGLRTSQILTLLLGKAFYLGLLGALLGVGGGLVLGLGLCETTLGQAQARQLIEPNNLLLAAAMAPVIAMLGSWLPAIAAARQDPATILQEE